MSNAPEDRNRRVEDYVRGQADDETARQLEIEMLEDDDLFERVQTEDLLRRGLGETEPVASSERGKSEGYAAPLPRLGWALAASFGAIAVLLGVYSLQLNERINTLQTPSAGLPVITLLEQRSALIARESPVEPLATGSSGALIEIDVSAAESSRFHLALQTDRQRYKWDAVQRDERGYITIFLPPNETVLSIRVLTDSGSVIREYKFNAEG